jgi:two-component system phosphate regulon sensor histidine kinase PhoR
MSDSPVLARGSKTATVVVLVVFLQLLVIAVLGLGAITRDRREGVREAEERADADAVAAAEDSIRRIHGGMDEVVARVVEMRSPEELRINQQSPHVRIVDAMYQVDAKGVVYWFTGEQTLWLPVGVIMALEEQSVEQRDNFDKVQKDLELALAGQDHEKAINRLWTLLGNYYLALDPDPLLWGKRPLAAGWAIELLHQVMEAEGEHRISPTAALLKALEVEAINRGRSLLAASPQALEALRPIGLLVDEKLSCEPNQEELAALVSAFRHAHARLDSLLPSLVESAARLRRLGPDDVRARLLHVFGEPYAAAFLETEDRVVLAHLHSDEVLRLAAGYVATDAGRLARLGVRLEVVPSARPLADKVLYVRDLAREDVSELQLRAALYRDVPPPLPSGGPTEAFYLGIIGLAALGLIAGGAVLVRMWRREVRLARLKADFVSNLSHELKTPLTSISLFTEMLQEGKLVTEEERTEGLAVLAQESQRLQRIVARMIDVARREVRGTPYDLAPGDLNGPVRDAALRFRRIVTEPGLDLVVSLSPEPLQVLMDPAAVDDAVTNLLSNAWKYKRGERARIDVRTRRLRGKAELTVADDGIGIPRHERKRVFEMFYRAENYLTRNVAGTGLGLALVRSIVRAHRGRIRLDSGRGGVGTVFRLRFPLARVRAPAPAPSAADSSSSSPPVRADDALASPGPTRAQSTP